MYVAGRARTSVADTSPDEVPRRAWWCGSASSRFDWQRPRPGRPRPACGEVALCSNGWLKGAPDTQVISGTQVVAGVSQRCSA